MKSNQGFIDDKNVLWPILICSFPSVWEESLLFWWVNFTHLVVILIILSPYIVRIFISSAHPACCVVVSRIDPHRSIIFLDHVFSLTESDKISNLHTTPLLGKWSFVPSVLWLNNTVGLSVWLRKVILYETNISESKTAARKYYQMRNSGWVKETLMNFIDVQSISLLVNGPIKTTDWLTDLIRITFLLLRQQQEYNSTWKLWLMATLWSNRVEWLHPYMATIESKSDSSPPFMT